MGGLLLLGLLPVYQSHAAPDHGFEPRYRAVYLTAKTNWLAATGNVLRAWEFSRAAFDFAEFATNDAQRAKIAAQGIEAAESAIHQNEKSAPAHYYLAMNLGQLARTQLLGALKLVTQMEAHFKRVTELDPKFDFAGADRNLGILYREAPGWPASIGNRAKARTHLKKSVDLCPEYPANHLELLQAYVDWKETHSAEELVVDVRKCLADGRKEFTGEAWEWSWDDWEEMWSNLQKRLQKLLN